MDIESYLIAYVVGTVVSLAILYVLIRLGVRHGTTSALRGHELWMRDGGLQAALDAHAERLDRQQSESAASRAALARERG
jgi:hypothetical protein